MRSRDRNLEKCCPPTFTEPFEEKMLVILGINRGNFQNCLCEPDLAGDTCPEDPLRYSSMTYYPSDGLLRDSCGLLLVFPLSSRDYLALHLSAALLDYRASRSTQLRTTSSFPLTPLTSLRPACSCIHDACAYYACTEHRSYVLLFSRLFPRLKQCFASKRCRLFRLVRRTARLIITTAFSLNKSVQQHLLFYARISQCSSRSSTWQHGSRRFYLAVLFYLPKRTTIASKSQ